MSPPSGETFGSFFGGPGRGGEDRKQQLYKYLRVFAKTPDSPAHAGNYVIPKIPKTRRMTNSENNQKK